MTKTEKPEKETTEQELRSLELFAAGLEHFDALRFWEAHESWELLWLEAEDELVDFYQGLIQLAAAYHHMRRGTYRGAVRLFESALRRLEAFPPGFHDLDRAAAVAAAAGHRVAAAAGSGIEDSDYPKLIPLAG